MKARNDNLLPTDEFEPIELGSASEETKGMTAGETEGTPFTSKLP